MSTFLCMSEMSMRLPILEGLLISLLKSVNYSWNYGNDSKYCAKLTNEVTLYIEQVNFILCLGFKKLGICLAQIKD